MATWWWLTGLPALGAEGAGSEEIGRLILTRGGDPVKPVGTGFGSHVWRVVFADDFFTRNLERYIYIYLYVCIYI